METKEHAPGENLREAASEIQWHPAFYSACELEFRENRQDLSFEKEFQLSSGPLAMDLLIIKWLSNVPILNPLGHIFRKYNVWEYKSPEDGLSIDDFYKTVAYACLYKASGGQVDQIPAEEITVTLLRDSYPRELFRDLEAQGFTLRETVPGVYYLEGKEPTFPTQIIVSSRLEHSGHSWLKVLKRGAEAMDVEQFLKASKAAEYWERNCMESVLQVSAAVNAQLYKRIREESGMSDVLMELMKEDIEKVVHEAEQRVLRQAAKESDERLQNVMRESKRNSILDTVGIYREEMGLDDQAIMGRISKRYHLSPAEARSYVIPESAGAGQSVRA